MAWLFFQTKNIARLIESQQFPSIDPAMTPMPVRCAWANPVNPRYLAYHDEEWGVPCHDETRLFEMLNLEGAQAGLSWETVLNKRDSYRTAFDHWDAEKIARYDAAKVAALLANPGIIRNRLKVAAMIGNAQAYLRLRDEVGGLDPFLWAYVGGAPIRNAWKRGETPAKTSLSDRLSKDLGTRGFKFVGSTIVYAYMQAIGMVNDHCVDCFLHARPASVRAQP
jgi:DNA-3-methyladenine glycosylase I